MLSSLNLMANLCNTPLFWVPRDFMGPYVRHTVNSWQVFRRQIIGAESHNTPSKDILAYWNPS